MKIETLMKMSIEELESLEDELWNESRKVKKVLDFKKAQKEEAEE